MPSAVDLAKRELVKVLRELAEKYGVVLTLTRDSANKDVEKAFRKVARRVHPDKGGLLADFQKLSATNDTWRGLLKNAGTPGRPKAEQRRTKPKAGKPWTVGVPEARNEFSVRGQAVLLTYQGFSADLAVFLPAWKRFVSFVATTQKAWGVKFWTATAETNDDAAHHLHLMLQFCRADDARVSSLYSFEGVLPNASSNDLLGEGFAGKRYQASVDRGQFYCWANKKGTVADGSGKLCRAGNCEPAWTREVGSDLQATCLPTYKYKVSGDWPKKLWQEYKLDETVYEEYLYLCKDKLAANKRNLELYQSWKRERDLQATIKGRTKRIKSNPSLYTPFGRVPEAEEWLAEFSQDAMRYPVLLVHAPSFAGKSEWAVSLFKNPLYVEIGSCGMWPARMKKLDRSVHDGLVADDLRDLSFLENNQEKLQGKYNRPVELFTTPGGDLAVTLDLFRLPIVFTINNDTRNQGLLKTSDFLKKRGNVRVLSFSGRPGEAPPAASLPEPAQAEG